MISRARYVEYDEATRSLLLDFAERAPTAEEIERTLGASVVVPEMAVVEAAAPKTLRQRVPIILWPRSLPGLSVDTAPAERVGKDGKRKKGETVQSPGGRRCSEHTACIKEES